MQTQTRVCSQLTKSLRCACHHNSLTILGVPPFARGTDVPGQDLEMQAVRLFPRCALLVEKPVCSVEPAACRRVAEVLEAAETLVGVGYMLRYLKGELRWQRKCGRSDRVVRWLTRLFAAVQMMK
jgi:hypothetical protein